ncbi:MAG TPA: sterol desaturase family protein [Mucilaginibacter sp.]|jgi:sterol desaturase/sphingolipid hydroxylase (fatty acid hydroxylase superfamily)
MKPDFEDIYYILPALITIITLEVIEMIRENHFGAGKKSLFASVCIGSVAIAIASLVKGVVLYIYVWIYQFRLFTLPADIWWAWVICFFADDISYYWFHRCSHQIRFLWASHIVHHSAQTFTLSTALRLPWTSNITGTFLFWAWMPLVGLSPVMIVTMKSLSAIYQFWLHTEKIKKLPKWFEAMFNTPSHHAIHHSSLVNHLDKNHGGTLMICDRLFGTFLNKTQKPVYGLTKNINSNNPFVIIFYEWANLFKDLKKSKTFIDCLNFIFNSPGWTNNGNSKTTRILRAERLMNKGRIRKLQI